ncbi:Ku protein [Acidipila sp. EB88]|uniref:non-homologous end joining protein Ku n=1 Tax=Acidipila sp. EB88 TaxID=2305226 RepID=UPI000F5E8275|nr:Ku protein [Acidipila sp. EB88]RRA49014.1 Ku protein [Acidipila sp. EB88]
MASTVWKGYISFGLISVPIRMYVAAREEHIGFNQIHKSCGTRIKQQLYCPTDERVVERNEIEKGYPTGDGGYVLISQNELKSLEAESSETMAIQQFVELDEVDPIYYETSYYTVAEEPGRRAYALMLQAMGKLKLGAIAKLTLHQREQVVIIRPYEHGLILHTLYYPEEVREIPEFGDQAPLELQEAEIKLAEQFMGSLRAPFHPDAFHNTYQEKVEQLIESKGAGEEGPEPEKKKKPMAPVINLMDALRASLAKKEASGASAPAAEVPAAKTAAAKKAAPAAKRRKTG